MKTVQKTSYKEASDSAYLRLVESVYEAENVPMRYKGTMESMLQEFFSKTSKKKNLHKRIVFKRLLVHAYDQKCFSLLRNYYSVKALHSMCSFGDRLQRNVEDWVNQELSAEKQISSLIRHCFAKFETPAFLEASFFSSDKIQILWYVQLGAGRSVKTLSQMPLKLSSKMAHEFRHAPEVFTPWEALRYAQALGFGASSRTAKILAQSCLAQNYGKHEVFWSGAVQFFSRKENIENTQLQLILDYLEHAYANNPSLNFKGRTYGALLKQSQEWQKNVYINSVGGIIDWKPSGITPLYREEYEQGKKIVYKTIELLNSAKLYDEGKEMNHCVAEYNEVCQEKKCAIFSMQRELAGQEAERLATIEIELPNKELGEFKAKFNQEPSSKAQDLLDYWIENSELKRPKAVNYEVQQAEPEQQLVLYHGTVDDRTNDEMINFIRIVFWLMYLLFKLISMAN